jgi:hypothetical protein
VKGAGAVINLAVAFDADEYPRPVQQQLCTIHALSDKIGVQRQIVENLVQGPSNGATHRAVNRIAHSASIEGLQRAQL